MYVAVYMFVCAHMSRESYVCACHSVSVCECGCGSVSCVCGGGGGGRGGVNPSDARLEILICSTLFKASTH